MLASLDKCEADRPREVVRLSYRDEALQPQVLEIAAGAAGAVAIGVMGATSALDLRVDQQLMQPLVLRQLRPFEGPDPARVVLLFELAGGMTLPILVLRADLPALAQVLTFAAGYRSAPPAAH